MKQKDKNIEEIKQILFIIFLLSSFSSISSQEKMKHKSIEKIYKTFPALTNKSFVAVDEDYSYGHGYCDPKMNCFLPFAVCLNSNTCLCMPDYANVYIKGESISQIFCSYKKKKIIVAGLLELFLPFGLGHFYSGHHWIGSVKFFFSLGVFMFSYLICCKHIPPNFGVILCYVILCCAIPIWNLVDLFLFFSGTVSDGFGIPMS